MKFVGIIKLTLILPISSVKLKVSELINPPLQEFSQMPHFLAKVVGVKVSLILVFIVQVLLKDL
jgi:hypothetical protein